MFCHRSGPSHYHSSGSGKGRVRNTQARGQHDTPSKGVSAFMGFITPEGCEDFCHLNIELLWGSLSEPVCHMFLIEDRL